MLVETTNNFLHLLPDKEKRNLLQQKLSTPPRKGLRLKEQVGNVIGIVDVLWMKKKGSIIDVPTKKQPSLRRLKQ